MTIVPFDRIRDYYQFMKLMHGAFNWAESPKQVARVRRLDPRFRDPFGFALQEGTRLLGFVGTVDIPMKTMAGDIEMVGGIHSVATDPDAARSGVATRLMDHSHRFFRRRGYRFSFLCTSRSLVAHGLYERLGYTDIRSLEQYPRAYRAFPERRGKTRRSGRKPDFRLIQRIFTGALRDRTGCAVRGPDWPRALSETRDLKPENIITHPQGYAFTSTWSKTLFIEEWQALTRAACESIYDRLELRRMSAWIVGQVDGEPLKSFLAERDFGFAYGRYGVRMVKPLGRANFDAVFGDRFSFAPLDSF
jgi:ribosomal protein S18 acetylase RimI-like enzyme